MLVFSCVRDSMRRLAREKLGMSASHRADRRSAQSDSQAADPQASAPPPADNFSNFKMPVIAVAVVLVLGYQYMKQKGKGAFSFVVCLGYSEGCGNRTCRP